MKQFAYSIYIVLITIIVCEIGLRVFNYFYPSPIFYDQNYRQFLPKPHDNYYGFRLNSGGFKDKEFPKKQKDVYRIVGVGDSFAFGITPYQHNYLTLLENGLKLQKKRSEVLNIGISGTNVPEYLSTIVEEGLPLKPDLILLSFYVGNDFMLSHKHPNRLKLFKHSRLATMLNYVGNVVQKVKNPQHLIYGGHTYCDSCGPMTDTQYAEVLKRRLLLYEEGNPEFDSNFEEVMDWLQRIQQLCQKQKIDLCLVIIPAEEQLYPKVEGILRKEHRSTKVWNKTKPQRVLVERLKEMQIPFLDLYPVFQKAAQKQVLYRPNDTHWNVEGNALAAQEIHNWLLQFPIFSGFSITAQQ